MVTLWLNLPIGVDSVKILMFFFFYFWIDVLFTKLHLPHTEIYCSRFYMHLHLEDLTIRGNVQRKFSLQCTAQGTLHTILQCAFHSQYNALHKVYCIAQGALHWKSALRCIVYLAVQCTGHGAVLTALLGSIQKQLPWQLHSCSSARKKQYSAGRLVSVC